MKSPAANPESANRAPNYFFFASPSNHAASAAVSRIFKSLIFIITPGVIHESATYPADNKREK